MIKKWQTKKSKEVFKTKWFSIRQDDCVVDAKKRIKDFYVIDSPNGVMVVPLTATGEVILVRQFRQSLRQITLECPAGFTGEEDKSLEGAARRELLEETGYSAKEFINLGDFYLYPSKLTTKIRIFLAKNCKKICNPAPDENEIVEIKKLKFSDVIKSLGKKKVEISDSSLAILLAEKYYKNK